MREKSIKKCNQLSKKDRKRKNKFRFKEEKSGVNYDLKKINQNQNKKKGMVYLRYLINMRFIISYK